MGPEFKQRPWKRENEAIKLKKYIYREREIYAKLKGHSSQQPLLYEFE